MRILSFNVFTGLNFCLMCISKFKGYKEVTSTANTALHGTAVLSRFFIQITPKIEIEILLRIVPQGEDDINFEWLANM